MRQIITIALIVLSQATGVLAAYQSPFAITLDENIANWTTDFATRADAITANSTPDPAQWYNTDYGSVSYGPLNPQLYSVASSTNPAIAGFRAVDRGDAVFNVALQSRPSGVNPVLWQQQRLLHAASQYIGTHYQHLHLPDFDPAAVDPAFPWSPVSNNSLLQTTQDLRAGQPGTEANPYAASYGSPQPGIDCTDFAALIYNLALGIQMFSGTPDQVTFTSGTKPETDNMPTATILDAYAQAIIPEFQLSPNYGTAAFNEAGSLDTLIASFQPGDLLYMRNSDGFLSHVVIWLGIYGTLEDGSPSSIPLVISSHDNTPAIFDTLAIDAITGLPLDNDILAHLPPPGVQILPFVEENWFYQNFSLSMRVIPEPATYAWFVALGAAIPLLLRKRRR
jgi:cell wall-associated NlpC family hydrolase